MGTAASLDDAIAAAQANPHDASVWRDLGLMIIAQGYPQHLRLFDQCQASAGNPLVLLFLSLFSSELALNSPLRQRLLQFADHVDPQDPYGTVVRFFAACAMLFDGNDDGVAALRSVCDTVKADQARFAACPHLVAAPGFSRLVLTKCEVQERWDEPAPLVLPEVTWVGACPPDGPEPLSFAACDGRYFERFADRFLAAIAAIGPAHIHVVDPTPEQVEGFRRRVGSSVSFSFERTAAPAFRASPYYASVRFFCLPEIMRRSRRDVLMLDIDLARIDDLDVLSGTFVDQDVVYFAMPTLMPWLRNHAAMIFLRNNDKTTLFAQRLAALLLQEIEGARWFVDQLCFGSVLHAVRGTPETPSVLGLEQADGFPFARFIVPSADNVEKNQLRTGLGL